MKLFPRSVLGSLGSILSPKKEKSKGAGKDTAEPSVPGNGKDIPTPSAPGIVSGLPTPSIPGIADDIPTPSVTGLDKDIPTPSAAVAAKGTPAPNVVGPGSTIDGNVSTSTVTTSVTVSVTDTSTVTSADVTVTIVQHDLATVATTASNTVTRVQHDLTTVAMTVPSTILTTKTVTPSTSQTTAAHTTAALAPAIQESAIPVAKKHAEAGVILSIIFGLTIMGLLSVICFLVIKLRRLARAKQIAGMKTYAEEFNWPQQRPVEMSDIGRKDEWGPKQKEAWGIA